MRAAAAACAAAMAIMATPAIAQVYKCQVGGKTVFTDQPCDDNAKPLTIRPGAGYSADPPPREQPSEATQDQPPGAAPNAQRTRLDDANMRVKRRILQSKIATEENRIIALRQRRDAELDDLRHRKGYASNNLAGATYMESLSTEMQVINSRYDTEIRIVQSDIEHMRRELADLK